jgi:hypothetical protein
MSLINSSHIEDFCERLQKLEENSRPRYGKLLPMTLLDHLSNSLEIALGLRDVALIFPLPIGRIARFFAFLPFPMPPFLPTSAEFIAPRTGAFEERRSKLLELLRLFHREVLQNPVKLQNHPVLGRMNRIEWAKLQDRHFEHHFKQFGL